MTVRLFAALAVVLAPAAARTADQYKTVADAVAASKGHTILLTALQEAGVFDTLKGKGPLTLFAPTDAAFKKIDDDTLKKIVADKTLLKKILLAHVVTGKALSAKDLTGLEGRELNGFRVSAKGGLKVGDAKVTTADLQCGNGVVHVIDAVLVPTK
jgi:uncharacterized surface protein with fasciclin (FAS1) repeats